MKKKLPNLYVNKIEKKLDNNKTIFYSAQKEIEQESPASNIVYDDKSTDVNGKIRELFNSPNYVYKMNVNITLKDKKVINKDVIGQVGNQLITIDEESIDIDNILDIKF